MERDPDLINRLLTRAGMIMEDASIAAIVDDPELPTAERIAAVRKAGAAIVMLADAAGVVIAV